MKSRNNILAESTYRRSMILLKTLAAVRGEERIPEKHHPFFFLPETVSSAC